MTMTIDFGTREIFYRGAYCVTWNLLPPFRVKLCVSPVFGVRFIFCTFRELSVADGFDVNPNISWCESITLYSRDKSMSSIISPFKLQTNIGSTVFLIEFSLFRLNSDRQRNWNQTHQRVNCCDLMCTHGFDNFSLKWQIGGCIVNVCVRNSCNVSLSLADVRQLVEIVHRTKVLFNAI